MALATIYQVILEDTLLEIVEKQTVKGARDTLKTIHLGADRMKNAKVQTLKTEFDLLWMKETDSIDNFKMKLTTIVNKARALGAKMEEDYVVKKLLWATLEKYLSIVSTIEQFRDIDKMYLEEAIGYHVDACVSTRVSPSLSRVDLVHGGPCRIQLDPTCRT